MAESSANILHEHYKDTFSHIREREKQRDRLFLIVIAVLGFLVFQLTYTKAASQLFSEVEVLGVTADPSKLPVAALLSTTWTMLAAILLRYCQVTIHVDKQYDYLHTLEAELSGALGKEGLIARESAGYHTAKSRWFRKAVWLFYIAAVPLVLLLVTAFAMWMEWSAVGLPVYHQIFDSVVAGGVVILVVLYVAGVCFSR